MLEGTVAEFDSSEALERAYDALERAGYVRLWSWTPYAVKGLVRRLPESLVPYIMLCAGLVGAAFAFVLQWWCNGLDFPIDVGGRPLLSVPAFIPIAFETTILFASLAGFFVTLGFSGLPRLHHPLFEVSGFERATIDRFFIGVDARDPRFEESVGDRLLQLGALRWERIGRRP